MQKHNAHRFATGKTKSYSQIPGLVEPNFACQYQIGRLKEKPLRHETRHLS
jgi:hypothetical protein